MVTLKHALLATSLGISRPGFKVMSILDIVNDWIWMSKSFPVTEIRALVFWAAGTPDETFSWSLAVFGPAGQTFTTPSVPGRISSIGECEGATQLPIHLSATGSYRIVLSFGGAVVWERRIDVYLEPSASAPIQ